ncbi:MAG: SAM-dependent methyltransferase [Bacteroidetes bacterium]|nr:MAG: SAM-dependent methyltransferase [Bacteroidota bacterium]
MSPKLYLLPNTLGNPNLALSLPPIVGEIARRTKVFIVEDLRNARRFLKQIDKSIDIDSLCFHLLNEHTPASEVPRFLEELKAGQDTALLSEAGLPGIADPGALVVELAHRQMIRVVPLTGPSSITLALMASGLNGQQFCFHGYLPVKKTGRALKIKALEQAAEQNGSTQIFIEAPYRNNGLLEDLIRTCKPGSRLCIAVDLTLDSEMISTKSIADWKKSRPDLHKRPAIFLLNRFL